jgi:hypothetical protein
VTFSFFIDLSDLASTMVVPAPTLQCGPRLLVIAVALTSLCNADTSSSSMCRCDIPCRRNSEVTQSVLSRWCCTSMSNAPLIVRLVIVTACRCGRQSEIARRRIARQTCTLLVSYRPHHPDCECVGKSNLANDSPCFSLWQLNSWLHCCLSCGAQQHNKLTRSRTPRTSALHARPTARRSQKRRAQRAQSAGDSSCGPCLCRRKSCSAHSVWGTSQPIARGRTHR